MWGTVGGLDERVIVSVLEGQRERYGELVRRHLPLVEAIARAQLGSPQQVEDVAQEAFLQAYLNLNQLRERRKFVPWLAAITRNIATGISAREGRQQAVAALWWREALPQETEPNHTRRELHAAVTGELAALTAEDRELLMLRYYAGKNSREISRALGISHAAVRKRLERARAALGARLLRVVEQDTAHAGAPSRREAKIVGAVLAAGTPWLQAGAAAAVPLATGGISTALGAGAAKLVVGMVVLGAAGVALVVAPPLLRQRELAQRAAVDSKTAGTNWNDIAAAAEPATAAPPAAPPASPASDAAADAVAGVGGIPIRGVVVHSDGTPIAGATVKGACWGEDRRSERYEAISDAAGRFELRAQAPCDMFLTWAEKEGYVRPEQARHVLGEEGLQALEVPLFREAVIEGDVVNELGTPQVDVPVTARYLTEESVLSLTSSKSEGGGRFRLAGLLPGKHGLALVKEDGWQDGIVLQKLELKEGEVLQGVRLQYTPGLVLEGRVTNEEGEPLNRVFVQVHTGEYTPRDAYTDEEGHYRIDQLVQPELSVAVARKGYEQEHRQMHAGENGDFVLRGQGSVTGRVIDAETGQPVKEFELMAVDGVTGVVPSALERWFEKVSDDVGTFTLEPVPLDEATVMARAEGYQAAFQVVSLEAREHLEGVTIALHRGLTIKGTVVAGGAPVGGALVLFGPRRVIPKGMDHAFFLQQLAEEAKATSGPDGGFVITGLAPGPKVISAYHPDHGSGVLKAEVLEAGSNDQNVIPLSRGGTIVGTITGEGEALDQVHVIATEQGGLGMPQARGEAGADGRYELPNVAAGVVTVRVFPPLDPNASPGPRGRTLMRDVTVAEGETTRADFDLTQGSGVLSGTLLLPETPEASGGNIEVNLEQDGVVLQRMVNLDPGATTFTVDGLPEGMATVIAAVMFPSPGQGPEAFGSRQRMGRMEVRAGETAEISFDFRHEGSIRGRVDGVAAVEHAVVMVLEGEVPMEGFSLTAMAEWAPLTRGASSVGQQGAYSVDALPAGTYTVVAYTAPSNGPDVAEKARFETAVVSLGEGATEEVVFSLE
jgi:RNA polymerase sigma factor (sigma-70 family)